VKAVLLDAAGTLIRPREPVGETYAAVARQFGMALDPDELSKAFARVLDDMPDLAFHWSSTSDLRRQERDWWQTLLDRVVGFRGSRAGGFDDFFLTLYGHYARGQAWECYPDVIAALKGLRARGCKLAVVSNFDSRLSGILRDLGIGDLMDVVVYSSGAGSAKPDPVIFKKALAALGVSAERAIHVGDSVRADIAGAAAAGIAGLLIRRGRLPAASSESVIGSLEDLLARADSVFPTRIS
jgi:putative hydrolase of the HAD superfamily